MLLRELQMKRTLDRYRTPKVAAVSDVVPIEGVVAVEGEVSGDGRRIEKGALRWDVLPVPIIWDRADGDHTGMIVGRYTSFTRRRDGNIWGVGELGETDDADAAAAVGRIRELIRDGAMSQSVALDEQSVRFEARASRDDAEEAWSFDDQVEVTTSGRVRHVALVDTAAFAQAVPQLASTEPGMFEAMVAAVTTPLPASHVAEWRQDDWQPLTFEPDGRIWGHAAGNGCHRSSTANCWLYPGDVDPKMAGFHTGSPVPLDDGTTVRLGPLTFGGLHADPSMSREQARRIHEDGSTIVGLVRAFQDHKGRLAVAGTMVPGLDETTRAQLAGTAPSYEMWPGAGGLTLIGLHMVPTPAHPVAASVDGGGLVAVDCACDEPELCELHAEAAA
jgi:hypothetical protein